MIKKKGAYCGIALSKNERKKGVPNAEYLKNIACCVSNKAQVVVKFVLSEALCLCLRKKFLTAFLRSVFLEKI